MFFSLFQRYKSRLAPKGSFSANVLTLMTGTTIAQAIPLAISPILTRLYTPNDFGVFALFSSLISIVAIVATGRYEFAIMLPEDDDDAINLLALSIGISFSISCISMGVIVIFNSQIATALKNKELSIWLYWIPVAILLTGIYQALYFWSSRSKQYERLSASKIMQSVANGSTSLLFGFGGLGGGLIFGNLIGQGCSVFLIIRQTWSEIRGKFNCISNGSIRKNAYRFRDFPLANALHAFLDAAQTSGIYFLMAIYYGSGILGSFSFVSRVLRTPLNLIGSSVSQVFYQKATEIHREKGDLHPLMRKTMYKLAFIGSPILVIVLIFAPEIFSFVFGRNWLEAGIFAQILAPWIFLNFIVSPISGIYLVVNKQKEAIWFALVDLVAKLGSVSWGVLRGSAKEGLMAMSLLGVLILIVGIAWSFNITKKARWIDAPA